MTRPPAMHGPVEGAEKREILRCTVGSTVHGLALDGQDDLDLMGIWLPSPADEIGLGHPHRAAVRRTQPEGVRSGPGDVDFTSYTVRHWATLVANGNPTMMLPLFVPSSDVLTLTAAGNQIREDGAYVLLSQIIGPRYLGYLDAQRERMLGGGKRNRVPNRPELVAAHGYDVKYAAHALRLGLQGVELMLTGRLTLPMPERDREPVMAVRRGEVDQVTALGWIDDQRQLLQRVIETSNSSPLPETLDWAGASEWLADFHLAHWGKS